MSMAQLDDGVAEKIIATENIENQCRDDIEVRGHSNNEYDLHHNQSTHDENYVHNINTTSIDSHNDNNIVKSKSRSGGGGGGTNQKTNFRAPQQFGVQKKIWNKPFKTRPKNHQQSIKADMENIQNLKNQTVHRKQTKNIKQNYKMMIQHRTAQFALRSKFFLPDKRPRKEIIIPPTKFLLGGNISDPLNLNSLQDEALNATTPTPTPKQSPITTPPKVEVIIPPNIYDPLHLLDPVDSIEYEKQLVSPMKRKSKAKHRHRKKKPKRKRLDSGAETLTTTATTTTIKVLAGAAATIQRSIDVISPITSSCNLIATAAAATSTTANEMPQQNSAMGSTTDDISGDLSLTHTVDDDEEKSIEGGGSVCGETVLVVHGNSVKVESTNNEENICESASKLGSSLAFRRSVDREKVTRDLRLDLSGIEVEQQQFYTPGGSGTGRKRKISEGPNSLKNKFRRMDSKDKIVSPVIPQPGAWKRPPRTVPTGGRKGTRLRSTSVSETELISPTEETKTNEESVCGDDTSDTEPPKPVVAPATTENPPKTQQEPTPKFKPEGAKYQYGNYDRYSGYRNLNEFMDVRLQVFNRYYYLFRGKDVLDIGCNVGHMTIAIAKDLTPKSIVGLDIDRNLITRARKNLLYYVTVPKDKPNPINTEDAGKSDESKSNVKSKTKNTSRRRTRRKRKTEKEKNNYFPISFAITYGGIKDASHYSRSNKDEASPPYRSELGENFPNNVLFKATNYVLKDESLLNNETQQYDVIMCLSVTKWIHLNFGDAGLKLAFKRMFNQLRPGGKLILEAQNWASYKKKKNLTETIYNNYRNIEFFPNKFHEYLLSNEVGFSHSYCLGVPRHMSKGFCRPIQLYAKGDFTPNHIRWSDNYHPQTPYEAYRGIYAGMARPPHLMWGTPHGTPGQYSCRQTPLHAGLSTSQYYNPLETDSYLPSYDTQIQNRHYVFASPLYQTVWSPPASLRNSSSHTPVFGSVRDSDIEEGCTTTRHVYPPNDSGSSPQTSGSGGYNSTREPDPEDSSIQLSQDTSTKHVYATCENSTSPLANQNLDNTQDCDDTEQESITLTTEIIENPDGDGD